MNEQDKLIVRLTAEEHEQFLRDLANPRPPTPEMQAALANYRKHVVELTEVESRQLADSLLNPQPNPALQSLFERYGLDGLRAENALAALDKIRPEWSAAFVQALEQHHGDYEWLKDK